MKRIRESTIFTPVLTENYYEDAECIAQFVFAVQLKKPMIFVIIDGKGIEEPFKSFLPEIEHYKTMNISGMTTTDELNEKLTSKYIYEWLKTFMEL